MDSVIALAGAALHGVAGAGPTIRACFGVGRVGIRESIVSGAASSPEAIGELLRAGSTAAPARPS